MNWYRKAAEQGDADAQNSLAMCYYMGQGVAKDAAEAVKWYRKAAEQNSAIAQCSLGYAYQNGEGVSKDPSEAMKWYRKAAEQGLAEAQYNLGVYYDNGAGVTKDEAEAVNWYRKAAEQGDAVAQGSLAMCYYRGQGVTKDDVEAMKWFLLAAAQGDKQSSEQLAKAEKEMTSGQIAEARRRADDFKSIKEGFQTSIVSNAPSAIEELRAQAEQDDPGAQFRLGKAYYTGEGVSKNLVEGIKWYRKAAELGDADAQHALGTAYATGIGVKENLVEAANWFLKAEKRRSSLRPPPTAPPTSMVSNSPSTIEEIRAQAEKGDMGSQFKLGRMYAGGTGVGKDDVEAAKWYRKAAELGHHEAQSWLGTCYANGEGVEKDYSAAYMWLHIASENGIDKAKSNLAVVEAQMTSDQITEARRRADDFNRQHGGVQNSGQSPGTVHTTATPTMNPVEALQHLPTDRRLNSGSILVDNLQGLGGKGKLTLDNGLAEDAFVKMINGEKLVASFYVRGGERFTFDHAPDGFYKIIYCTGFGWNEGRRDFARGRHAVRYDKVLNYTTTRRTEGNTIITSTGVITLTMHKTPDGNTQTSDIPLEEFDRY